MVQGRGTSEVSEIPPHNSPPICPFEDLFQGRLESQEIINSLPS